jgi:RNA polymerase subunit RPABC4/transcription elongation factor Spt4
MDLQDFVTQLERILRIGITIIAAYLVALWIASVWWTFRDIRARTTDIFLQVAATLLVAVFSFPGLLIYVILRPPKTLAQLYEDSLEEEAFLQGIQVHNSCPVCKQRVEPDFIFCPWCQTRLKRTCLRCERPLTLRWKMCPYCGTSVYATPAAEETAAVGTLPQPEAEADLVESRSTTTTTTTSTGNTNGTTRRRGAKTS